MSNPKLTPELIEAVAHAKLLYAKKIAELQDQLTLAEEKIERPIKINLFRICCHCNKEFKVETAIIVTEAVKGATGHVANFMDCPLCKKRNDIWVRIQALKGE